MAYTLTFYNDQLNSDTTLRPSSVAGSANCVWKQGTAMLSPSFTITAESVNGFTYFYVAEWDRYYKIDDIIHLRNDVFEISGTVDVLKSWRDTIRASTQYVARSANNVSPLIVDSYYPITAQETRSKSVGTNPFNATSNFANGKFIIATTGTGGSVGGITYYEMTGAAFSAMVDAANSAVTDNATITEWSDQAVLAFIDPFKYLKSAMFFPLACPAATTPVHYGPYGALSGVTGDPLTQMIGTRTVTIDIPKHPQYNAEPAIKAYLQGEPYSEYYLRFPCFGMVKIPSDQLVGLDSISCTVHIDWVTGGGTLLVHANDQQKPILMLNGQVGVPIAVSSINPGREMLSGVPNAISSALSGNIGAIIGSAASISSAMLSPTPNVTGSTGSVSSFMYDPALIGIFHHIADDNPTNVGRPYCKRVVLNTCSGYTQTANAHLHAGTSAESEEIERIMNGGFYLE